MQSLDDPNGNEKGRSMGTEPTLEGTLRDALTRRQLLGRAGVGGLALSAPALLSACGTSSNPDTAPQAAAGPRGQVDHLTWMMGSVTSLDIARSGSLITSIMATEPVLILDQDLKPTAHLADWHAQDATTYVYRIRRGIRFWNGTPLTAEDIAFAMQRHLDPKVASQYAGLIPPLKGIDVTGPGEVTVRLEQPNATWQYMPTFMLVAPKKLFQEQGKDFGAPGSPIMGTGPFKVTSFRADSEIEYAANDDYWGVRPIAKRLTLNLGITDDQSAFLAMRAGNVDGTFLVSAALLHEWRATPDVTIVTKPAPHLTFASFDVAAKPWDDVHVRRAFAHALDKEGLAKALLNGAGQAEQALVPRNMWGGMVPQERLDEIYADLPVYEFDLDKARHELAQSAYPDGLTDTFWFYSAPTSQKIGLNWQQNLAEIGVTLKLETISDTVGTSREDNHHDLGFHVNDSWAGEDFPDPIDFAINLLPSDHAREGFFNEANYKNPVVDRLIEQNLASLDVDERADAMAAILKAVATDVPYIPIFTRSESMAIRNTFVYEGYTPWFANQQWIDHVGVAA